MKVLFVIPANKKNGKLHFSSFIKREVMSLEDAGIIFKQYNFTARLGGRSLFQAKKKLSKLISAFQPDLIHVQYGSVTAFLAVLTIKRKPWVLTLGGSDLLGHPLKSNKWYWKVRDRLGLWMSLMGAGKADKIICVSENLKRELQNKHQNKTIVIPRGIILNQFNTIEKAVARKHLSWSSDSTKILFSQPRNGAKVKNLPLAEASVEKLKKITNKKIDFIKLQGFRREELVMMLNAADVLLVTSIHEGSPNIVKEAMACNLPVVSVPCGDVPERLKNVQPSEICDYDATQLAEALHKVIKRDQRSNGRDEIIAQGLSQNKIAQKIISVYESLTSISERK